MTQDEFLAASPVRRQWLIMEALRQGLAKNVRLETIAAGTVYTLTTTAAAVDFGTTDPTVTLPASGTYRIEAVVDLAAAGATITTQTLTIKLRRTNNTAADLTGGDFTLDIPVMTTLTHTLGRYVLVAYYTTANEDDVITIFGNISVALGAGTITVAAAQINAVQLY